MLGTLARSAGRLCLAVFSLSATVFFLAVPWKARSALSSVLMRLILLWSGKSNRAFEYATSLRSIGRDQVRPSLKENALDRHYDRAMILFSGGTDSTLAAAYTLNSCDKVYLVTFFHSGMGDLLRSRERAEKLRRFFKPDRVHHDMIDVQQVLDAIRKTSLRQDLRRDKGFLVNACAICKLTMYLCAAAYCKENNIHMIASGCNKDGADLIADSMPSVISLLSGFFSRRGVEYATPVYTVERTDWKLFEMGLSEKKDLKLRATRSASTIQPSCELSFPLTLYGKGYFDFVYGQEAFIDRCREWYREKLQLYADKPDSIIFLSKLNSAIKTAKLIGNQQDA